MPTKREREYYRMGFEDGRRFPETMASGPIEYQTKWQRKAEEMTREAAASKLFKPKRKLSAWQKFVKANSRKKEFRYRDGKLNLKKMGVAYRRKKRR